MYQFFFLILLCSLLKLHHPHYYRYIIKFTLCNSTRPLVLFFSFFFFLFVLLLMEVTSFQWSTYKILHIRKYMHGNPILLDFNWSNSNCMVATNDFDSEMWKNITPVKENAWPKRNPTLEVSSIFQSNSAPPPPPPDSFAL